MKQQEDKKTLELELDGKRGRGRPPKADALTDAQRAKRYRDNKRLNKSDDVTKKLALIEAKRALFSSDEAAALRMAIDDRVDFIKKLPAYEKSEYFVSELCFLASAREKL